MNFVEAIKSAYVNYAVFEGRASRSEYWWFALFTTVVSAVLDAATGADSDPNLPFLILSLIFAFGSLLPSIGVATRRLHDVNRSGWWQLIGLTIIGLIPLIYWLVKKGTDGPNRFGEDRLAALSASGTPDIVT
jgi:uncharacterized membrane protein YhaH (DUF805 family)